MVRHVAQEKEASRSRVSSMMGSCQTTRFASVDEDAIGQEDWRVGFASVTKGATNQVD
jgi:hypothetical protein